MGATNRRPTVSIRARQLQRANLRQAVDPLPGMMFQSAPANYSGRIIAQSGQTRCCLQFQSAPANYSGRIIDHFATLDHRDTFQSAPANYSGRIALRRASPQVGRTVSIRARQLQRANQEPQEPQEPHEKFQSAPANYSGRIASAATGEALARWGFNPRPPITAGESI